MSDCPTCKGTGKIKCPRCCDSGFERWSGWRESDFARSYTTAQIHCKACSPELHAQELAHLEPLRPSKYVVR